MTDDQWQTFVDVLDGKEVRPAPVGLIVDCPWLPGRLGMTILDYLTDDRAWLEANLAAVRRFLDVMLLPGFWPEYGMCTEPAAFGARMVWPENDFPFAKRAVFDYAEIARIEKPDCRTDGLCPFVLRRWKHTVGEIAAAGHGVRFATSRGPWNIATYLLGHTETLLGVKTEPAAIHRLLDVVTGFIVDWLRLQAEAMPTIDGILVLDDLIGFLGEADFVAFVVPYFQRIAAALDVRVKMLHNDCHGRITAKHLRQMGFNVFNFSFEHPMGEIRRLAGEEVTLVGNVPPRDVLARGTPDDVRRAVVAAVEGLGDRRRLILSCGGGTPPGAPDENIDALVAAAAAL